MDQSRFPERDATRKILAVASQAITRSKKDGISATDPKNEGNPWTKHSFQIKKETLEKLFEFAETLGLKKYEALNEALLEFFSKRQELVKKIQDIKSTQI
mgnify:CR=1 FL=1